MAFFTHSANHETPAEADERRFNEQQCCKKCKMSVDGITWDKLGGYCPTCKRTEADEKSKDKHSRRKFW